MPANAKADTAPIVFEMTRHYDKPLATVWQAWSEAEALRHWWGPKGCSIDVRRFEFQPGGFFHYAMNFPGQPPMWGRFNYRQIEPLAKLVWLNSFSNENCGMARAPFSDECPLEIENTVTFTANGAGKTTVFLRARPFGEVAAERRYFDELQPSLQEGYGGTFDQLGEFLAR